MKAEILQKLVINSYVNEPNFWLMQWIILSLWSNEFHRDSVASLPDSKNYVRKGMIVCDTNEKGKYYM